MLKMLRVRASLARPLQSGSLLLYLSDHILFLRGNFSLSAMFYILIYTRSVVKCLSLLNGLLIEFSD